MVMNATSPRYTDQPRQIEKEKEENNHQVGLFSFSVVIIIVIIFLPFWFHSGSILVPFLFSFGGSWVLVLLLLLLVHCFHISGGFLFFSSHLMAALAKKMETNRRPVVDVPSTWKWN